MSINKNGYLNPFIYVDVSKVLSPNEPPHT